MEIVRPKPFEKEEIEVLFRTTITHTFEVNRIQETDDIEREVAVQMKSLTDDFETNGQSTLYWVAKLEGVIVGTVAIGPANEDIRTNLPDTRDIPELKSVYVLPAYQGMGIGMKLVRAMLQHLKETDQSQFVLDCGYKSAQEIWIHQFGQPTVELINHWEDNSSYMVWLIDLQNLPFIKSL